ncbi:hypothetical protein BC830DRAFT_1120608 [Chytriomyces sp. MP71]|nr:hypothetical protein BC830DRAFT_1120608 [Chytriomyces sp. MP71]
MATARPQTSSMRRSTIQTGSGLSEAYTCFSSNLIRSPTPTNPIGHSSTKKNLIEFLDLSECTLDASERELDPLELINAVLEPTTDKKAALSSVVRKSCLMEKPSSDLNARERKNVKFSLGALSRSETPEFTENEAPDQFRLYMDSRLDQLNQLVPVRADSLPRSSSLQPRRSSVPMKIPKRTSSLNSLGFSYKIIPERVA